MAKQPKLVRAWGLYDSRGNLIVTRPSRARAALATLSYPSQSVHRVTITPDPPKRAKKKAVGVVVDYAGRVSEWRSEGGGLSLKQAKKSKRPMVENEKKKARKR